MAMLFHILHVHQSCPRIFSGLHGTYRSDICMILMRCMLISRCQP